MKKTFQILLLIIISGLFLTSNVEAKNLEIDNLVPKVEYHVLAGEELDDFSHNCADLAKTLRLAGYIVLLAKILIPLIIIVKSSINLITVITSGSPDEFKKKLISLAYSLAAAVIIFFVPTIVDVIFGFINSYNTGYTEDAKICSACVFDPLGDLCTTHAEKGA